MENSGFKIIMIGSSTGGLPVIEGILKKLDTEFYAVLVAQHMPEGYTGMWAERLKNHTPFDVHEGVSGEEVKPGKAYIAPGNRHMTLSPEEPFRIIIDEEPPVNRFRPSVDVLFGSAAPHDPSRIIAVILTGMCSDGVRSMIELHNRGFLTVAQNKETSVVFGMNKEAIEHGAVDLVLSPDEMVDYFNRKKNERRLR